MHIVSILIAEALYESGTVADSFQLQGDAVFCMRPERYRLFQFALRKRVILAIVVKLYADMVVCTTVVLVQQHDIGDKSPFDVRIVSIVVEAIAGSDSLR